MTDHGSELNLMAASLYHIIWYLVTVQPSADADHVVLVACGF